MTEAIFACGFPGYLGHNVDSGVVPESGHVAKQKCGSVETKKSTGLPKKIIQRKDVFQAAIINNICSSVCLTTILQLLGTMVKSSKSQLGSGSVSDTKVDRGQQKYSPCKSMHLQSCVPRNDG